MDNQVSNTPNKTEQAVVPKKPKKYFVAGAVLVLIIGAIFSFSHFSHKNGPPVEKKPEPAFHRDEPTEKQIFQDDYKKKVKELLDSGNSVREVSKQTKIRKDEVRKIKKEKE